MSRHARLRIDLLLARDADVVLVLLNVLCRSWVRVPVAGFSTTYEPVVVIDSVTQRGTCFAVMSTAR